MYFNFIVLLSQVIRYIWSCKIWLNILLIIIIIIITY